jgi:hypothetical protein
VSAPTAPREALDRIKSNLGVSGIVRVLLRKQLQFERRTTGESIAERLVFNRSQKGNLRLPWLGEKKEPQALVAGPLLGAQAGIRNAKQRTPAQPSETFVGPPLHDALKLTLR